MFKIILFPQNIYKNVNEENNLYINKIGWSLLHDFDELSQINNLIN